jgi:hypothetical protein
MKIVEKDFYVSKWILKKQINHRKYFHNNTLATTIIFCKTNNQRKFTLVIAPKTLFSTWKNEIHKWWSKVV